MRVTYVFADCSPAAIGAVAAAERPDASAWGCHHAVWHPASSHLRVLVAGALTPVDHAVQQFQTRHNAVCRYIM